MKKFKNKRKIWISLDTNTNFRNMYDTIKSLESLPIIKSTCKNNNYYNDKSKSNKKLTKKIE